MIKSLMIKDVATYVDEVQKIAPLQKFNYFFGANGTGKTTISRLMENADNFLHCSVNWAVEPVKTVVYNRDFVEANFNLQVDLPGIFTLGEAEQAVVDKIAEEKIELDKILKDIKKKEISLNGDNSSEGKMSELVKLTAEFTDKCWEAKDKYDSDFQDAFKGVRNSKVKFKDKVLEQLENNNAEFKDEKELLVKASTLLGETPESKANVAKFVVIPNLYHIEDNEILAKKIVGKADVDIAAMIDRLGNSDWVSQGKKFLDVNDSTCPFCQQSVLATFEKSLTDYFDETFLEDINHINDILMSYKAISKNIVISIEDIIEVGHEDLDTEVLSAKFEAVDAVFKENIILLQEKLKEPASIINLKSTRNLLEDISELIEFANKSIDSHNDVVRNYGVEKDILISQIWKFILYGVLKNDIDLFVKKQSGLQKAIKNLNDGVVSQREEENKKVQEIKFLEKDTTSIQPTIDAINDILKSFGFTSFSLGKAKTECYYAIVRSDGLCAKETLSEGEKTFISFLYFYQLLQGSKAETGITIDRIVVIDDPVSSLDSDILFIVSSLIKALIDGVRKDNGLIKQVFVLTHNTYFFKEVTFNPKRDSKQKMKDETFWTVRKLNGVSKVISHDYNPIKSSYELMWQEIKRPERCTLTIQNTMRKILENYFTFLGNINKDKIIALFEGNERLICQSLFSWVNDGSHHSLDDLYVTQDVNMIETYLTVFQKIFEESKHGAHYQMMMGDAFKELAVNEQQAEEVVAV